MLEMNTIALATDYVAASNAHDLDRIEHMLAQDAIYHSSRVGDHEGNKSIRIMMDGFFSGFPDAHWNVDDFLLEGDNGVAFAFVMTATEARSGKRIEREGLERIFFSFARKIARVEVDA